MLPSRPGWERSTTSAKVVVPLFILFDAVRTLQLELTNQHVGLSSLSPVPTLQKVDKFAYRLPFLQGRTEKKEVRPTKVLVLFYFRNTWGVQRWESPLACFDGSESLFVIKPRRALTHARPLKRISSPTSLCFFLAPLNITPMSVFSARPKEVSKRVDHQNA